MIQWLFTELIIYHRIWQKSLLHWHCCSRSFLFLFSVFLVLSFSFSVCSVGSDPVGLKGRGISIEFRLFCAAMGMGSGGSCAGCASTDCCPPPGTQHPHPGLDETPALREPWWWWWWWRCEVFQQKLMMETVKLSAFPPPAPLFFGRFWVQ